MLRRWLRDDQWQRLEPMLPGQASDPVRTAEDNRLFIDAVLWIAHRLPMARLARGVARGIACTSALRDGRT